MGYFLCWGLEHATDVKEKHSPWESRPLFVEPFNGNKEPYQFNFFFLHFECEYWHKVIVWLLSTLSWKLLQSSRLRRGSKRSLHKAAVLGECRRKGLRLHSYLSADSTHPERKTLEPLRSREVLIRFAKGNLSFDINLRCTIIYDIKFCVSIHVFSNGETFLYTLLYIKLHLRQSRCFQLARRRTNVRNASLQYPSKPTNLSSWVKN